MDSNFARAVEALSGSFDRLLAMEPIRDRRFPVGMPSSGVYLFSEGGHHLYVGRSDDLRGRYGRHCRPGATFRMASFAIRLARAATGKLEASYKPGTASRQGLMEDPSFAAAFDDAKARIRPMDYRFVEEADPTRQALLEIYCAVALGTPYNHFDTH